MRTLLPCLILFLLYLLWERLSLTRARRRIPVCIAVTGIRGKSSVTRLLASILKEDGRSVVAKTTGSQAVILLPDGSQIELDRSVTPSILEQKQLVHRAARLKAECLVAEVMSIRPENHYVESRLLLRPDLVVLTNVRRDHTEAMGETEDAIASVLGLDICPRSTVFLPEKEDHEPLRAEARRCGATLIPVASGAAARLLREASDPQALEFEENLDLVCAVASRLGVRPAAMFDGVRKARHDIGRLQVWRYRRARPGSPVFLVNAFAANDPESTFRVLAKVVNLLPQAADNIIGVLNLRADRQPRTLQWLSVLRDGGQRRFRGLYVTGHHSRLVQRRLPEARVLKAGSAETMTETLCAEAPEPSIIFGFGNVKGAGRTLAAHWAVIGEPHNV